MDGVNRFFALHNKLEKEYDSYMKDLPCIMEYVRDSIPVKELSEIIHDYAKPRESDGRKRLFNLGIKAGTSIYHENSSEIVVKVFNLRYAIHYYLHSDSDDPLKLLNSFEWIDYISNTDQ